MKNDRIDEPYFRGRRNGTSSVTKRHFAGVKTYFRQPRWSAPHIIFSRRVWKYFVPARLMTLTR